MSAVLRGPTADGRRAARTLPDQTERPQARPPPGWHAGRGRPTTDRAQTVPEEVPMPGHLTHLESARDGPRFPPDRPHPTHQGRPLWVRYDLAAVGGAVSPQALAARPPSLWRYRELLPLPPGEEPV